RLCGGLSARRPGLYALDFCFFGFCFFGLGADFLTSRLFCSGWAFCCLALLGPLAFLLAFLLVFLCACFRCALIFIPERIGVLHGGFGPGRGRCFTVRKEQQPAIVLVGPWPEVGCNPVIGWIEQQRILAGAVRCRLIDDVACPEVTENPIEL